MAKNKNILIYLLLFILTLSDSFASPLRAQVQQTYTREIGVRELTGKNDGARIKVYLKSVGLKEGYSYCAAFVCWTLNECGIKNPRSAWAPSLFPAKNTIYKSGKILSVPQRGDVFGIYFANKKRIAHVGFIDHWGDKVIITVEANTNEAGSREGDGVYRKRRLRKQVFQVSSFIKE